MEEDAIIPIVMFLSTAAVMIVWLYLKHRSRVETQQTFRLALDKGTELSPEFIKHLAEPEPSKDRDLRRALIWYALSVGLLLIGLSMAGQDQDALRGLLAGAALPFTIGSAYLIMYRYGTKKGS